MTDQTAIDTTTATPAGALAEQVLDTEVDNQPRDYEAEARSLGWTPKEEFRGDDKRWIDAETFVKRGEEMMPILKAQNKAQKREIDELKRTMKQFQDYVSKAEERAYTRALAEIEERHAEAIETGDVTAAKRAMSDLRDLDKQFTEKTDAPKQPVVDEAQAKQELADWVENTGWYGTDEQKTKYADLQADLMGPATDWPGGQKAWLDELTKRTERKFSEPKPAQTTPGGGRPAPKGGSKSYADLPPEAKRQCDRFVKTIPGFTKEQYVKDFDWSA